MGGDATALKGKLWKEESCRGIKEMKKQGSLGKDCGFIEIERRGGICTYKKRISCRAHGALRMKFKNEDMKCTCGGKPRQFGQELDLETQKTGK